MSLRPKRYLLIALAAAAPVALWIQVGLTLSHPQPVASNLTQSHAVVWGHRVFTNAAQLKAWLAARGASYKVWARNHPTLAFNDSGVLPSTGHADQAAATKPPSQPGGGTTIPTSHWLAAIGWIALAVALSVGLGVAIVRSLNRAADDVGEPEEAADAHERERAAIDDPSTSVVNVAQVLHYTGAAHDH